jgi:hypothetical protein
MHIVNGNLPAPASTQTSSSQRQATLGLSAAVPVMLDGLKRVKPATCGWNEGLPDKPDRRAMRLRATASEPRLSDLPKLVPTVPRELSDHEQMLEATGHRQLAELVFAGARGTQELVTQGVQTLKKVLTRPVMGGQLHSMTVDQLIAKYEGDYEIWVSPAVNRKAGLPGNLLYFGENHVDELQMQAHKRIVFDLFDVKAGARLLLETQLKSVCENRAEILGLPAESCVMLEDKSPHLDKYKELDQTYNAAVMDSAVRILGVTPDSKRDWPCHSFSACADFVAKWWPKVPDEHVARITPFIATANQYKKLGNEELERVLPLRDRWIVRESRGYLDAYLLAIGFTGVRHIPGMQKLARKLPLITMVERGLWQRTLKKHGVRS